MINNDFDPYETIRHLEHLCLKNTAEIEYLSNRLAESCELAQRMAQQNTHLTNAVIKLQEVSRITNSRLNRIESDLEDLEQYLNS